MSIRNIDFYSNSNINLNDTYIHMHWQRIGALNKNISVKDAMTFIYNSKRKARITKKVKSEYWSSMKQNNAENKNLIDFLDTVADPQIREDIIIAMEKNLKIELDNILKQNEEYSEKLYNKGTELYKAISNDASNYTKIIDITMEALSLLPQTEGLALLYDYYRGKGKTHIKAIRAVLQDYEGMVIQDSTLKRAYNALSHFCERFGVNGIEWNVKSVQSQIGRNIFSTALGESVGFRSLIESQKTADKKLISQSNLKGVTATTTGTDSVISAGYDRPIAGKTDIQVGHLLITISQTRDPLKAFDIQVGVSEKFYFDQPWKTPNRIRKSSIDFSSGSGGRLGPTIDLITNNKIIEKYYIYNILAHSKNSEPNNPSLTLSSNNEKYNINDNFKDIQKANSQISRLIAARQIIRIFASATMNNNANNGVVDFSQFFYANGTLIPMYNIVLHTLYLLENDLNVRSGSNDIDVRGITFHISDQSKWKPWIEKSDKDIVYSAITRSSTIRDAIMNAVITAEIHLQKLSAWSDTNIK